jgi:hypothetical protein
MRGEGHRTQDGTGFLVGAVSLETVGKERPMRNDGAARWARERRGEERTVMAMPSSPSLLLGVTRGAGLGE